MKVLIAEDDRSSRCQLEGMLLKWDYEPVLAADGIEAWNALQSASAPQLALLDWIMPGMDGVEVCRKFREERPLQFAYIIILTVKDRQSDIVAGLEAGADDYVKKPFDREELRARLRAGRRIVELQNSLAERLAELKDAMAEIKVLQGLLPICMHCHKVRDDSLIWRRIEDYIQEHSMAQFSHSLCPDCRQKYYPEYNETSK